MRFTYGKGQKINEASLDDLYEKILNVLKAQQESLGILDSREIVTEWINDLLFLTGYADLDEVKPVETKHVEGSADA
ncbi:MAG: hypothetical protein QXF26_03925 [Candidatus Bathyarchaeia archaeon]